MKGYSSSAYWKAKEAKVVAAIRKIPKIPVTLKQVVINQNGYEQKTDNYYGFEPRNNVYRASWNPFPNLIGKEVTIEFRARNRVEAKKEVAARFKQLYGDTLIPGYHN